MVAGARVWMWPLQRRVNRLSAELAYPSVPLTYGREIDKSNGDLQESRPLLGRPLTSGFGMRYMISVIASPLEFGMQSYPLLDRSPYLLAVSLAPRTSICTSTFATLR